MHAHVASSAVAEHAVRCICVKPSQGVQIPRQALVCTPSAEKVPCTHAATTASAVAEQAVTTRWPAPAFEQAVSPASAVAEQATET
jgi:hypothetical protein